MPDPARCRELDADPPLPPPGRVRVVARVWRRHDFQVEGPPVRVALDVGGVDVAGELGLGSRGGGAEESAPAAAEEPGASRKSSRLAPPSRDSRSVSSLPGASRIAATAASTSLPAGRACPSMASSTSPERIPARAATDPSATFGIAAPGEGSSAATPTVDACTSSTAAAATRFAATPAEMTAALVEQRTVLQQVRVVGRDLGPRRVVAFSLSCLLLLYSLPAASAAFSRCFLGLLLLDLVVGEGHVPAQGNGPDGEVHARLLVPLGVERRAETQGERRDADPQRARDGKVASLVDGDDEGEHAQGRGYGGWGPRGRSPSPGGPRRAGRGGEQGGGEELGAAKEEEEEEEKAGEKRF